MARLADIVVFADQYLNAQSFKDYCPNGLQIEGKLEINKIVSGVTASQALIDSAIKKEADLILVHHGFFWRGESACIVGLKKKRISALLANNINLLAYHLPLDAHLECGNNAQIAERLGLNQIESFGAEKNDVGLIVEAASEMLARDFSALLQNTLNRKATHISAHKNKTLKKIGICTGGAQSYFEYAIEKGVDAFVTGEVSEPSYHLAMESGVDFFAAGHHATERYGVQAFAEILVKEFNVEHEYLEIENPI